MKNSTNSTAGGNTNPPPEPQVEKNITQKRIRSWCFTFNNYTEEQVQELNSTLTQITQQFGYGREVAPTTGTPHLQGWIHLKEGKTFTALKKLFDTSISWRPMKGTIKQNISYCSKSNDYLEWPPKLDIKSKILTDKYQNIIWKDWQQKIIEICKDPADSRTIHWVYDPVGNQGKSFLTKYILCKHPNALLVGGAGKDIKCALSQHIKTLSETEEKEPTGREINIPIILIDIPRDWNGTLSYSTLEEIKNGAFFSGKYESGMCLMEGERTIIVFSNLPPKMNAYTNDRLNIIQISNQESQLGDF